MTNPVVLAIELRNVLTSVQQRMKMKKGAKIKMIKALMLNKSFEDEKRAAGWGSE